MDRRKFLKLIVRGYAVPACYCRLQDDDNKNPKLPRTSTPILNRSKEEMGGKKAAGHG